MQTCKGHIPLPQKNTLRHKSKVARRSQIIRRNGPSSSSRRGSSPRIAGTTRFEKVPQFSNKNREYYNPRQSRTDTLFLLPSLSPRFLFAPTMMHINGRSVAGMDRKRRISYLCKKKCSSRLLPSSTSRHRLRVNIFPPARSRRLDRYWN